jgi:flavin reductase (DIM6/NTAB) family NADH-FMN oxidoreductase RutF
MTVDIQHYKAGMRRLAAGVSLITTLGVDGVRRGLTATAVCSVSLTPPTLLCCINRNSSAHDTILASRILAVNILAAEDQALADSFGGSEAPETRFDVGHWTSLVTGAPVLETAVAGFDCRVTAVLETGTHTVFIAEVVEARLPGSGEPLVYLAGAYGSFAGFDQG